MSPIQLPAYPQAIVTFTEKYDLIDTVIAEHVNALQREMVSLQNALGIMVAGTFPTLRERITDLEGVVDLRALDDDVMHLGGGTETVNGIKTFVAGIVSPIMRTKLYSEGTDLTFSGTGYVAGTPPCQGTFSAPMSGAVMIFIASNCNGTATGAALVDFQVFHGTTLNSTTQVRDVSDSTAAYNGSPNQHKEWGLDTVTGLIPNDLYTVRTVHRMSNNSTGSISNRRIVIIPLT